MKSLSLAFLLTATSLWTPEGLVPTIQHPNGYTVLVDSDPDDPWVYDEEFAPYEEEVLTVDATKTKRFLYHMEDGKWRTSLYIVNGEDNTVEPPMAWMKIPEPNLPKTIWIMGHYTKEELEKKLKEFDK